MWKTRQRDLVHPNVVRYRTRGTSAHASFGAAGSGIGKTDVEFWRKPCQMWKSVVEPSKTIGGTHGSRCLLVKTVREALPKWGFVRVGKQRCIRRYATICKVCSVF